MSKLAVLYATTEGQTMKIASHIAQRIREQGHDVDLHHIDALDDFDASRFDGVMLGGSIHEGHYQRYFVRWVAAHQHELASRPVALFTVCLAIESPHEEERAEARRFPDQLRERTKLVPDRSAVFAGALKYTQYSWLKRALMKQIAKHEDASIDTSKDHEYTSWPAVDAFTDDFLAHVRAGQGEGHPRDGLARHV
jgi:menaquinone-dependent protoporphyrinogen oxidase